MFSETEQNSENNIGKRPCVIARRRTCIPIKKCIPKQSFQHAYIGKIASVNTCSHILRLKSRNDVKRGNSSHIKPFAFCTSHFAFSSDKRAQTRGLNPLFGRIAAFTLSEVLITLGIIGIVASLTIPHLIQSQHERQTVVAVKKAYSTLSSAFTLAVQENGTPENWGLTDAFPSPVGAGIMLSKLSPYLNITKNCGTENGCFIDKTYIGLNNVNGINFYSDNRFAKVSLADGSNVTMIVLSENCSLSKGASVGLKDVCGDIWVDINGNKEPNQYGVDMFLFWISKTGITPFGTQPAGVYRFTQYCNKSSTALYENGPGCTAWVLYNENMDYLHCSDLSWSGKHTCN